jgi:SAM-dependent methyltransferase
MIESALATAGLAERITAVLSADPRVAAARVVLEPDETGRLAPLGWIVPAADWLAQARLKAQAGPARMAVKLWARVFDTAYFAPDGGLAGPNFAGWTSSLTGAPIPADAMDIWRSHTVDRIRALRPRDVLEIGCGLGLLLERLAPDCASYRATDISAEAIGRLGDWAAGQDRLRHVTVAQRAAHELDDLAPGSLDTVIINSVVQYFPDFSYLCRVLAAVAPRLVPGGHVFIGDVRDARLLDAFNAAVTLGRADPADTAGSLRRALHGRDETELAVDPRAFAALPGYGSARALLKHEGADNEMTRYRYDVVLRAGPPPQGAPIAERAWDAVADLSPPDRAPLLLRGIPNARLAGDLAAARLLRAAPAETPVPELRAASAGPPAGHDPAALARAAAQRGHRAEALCASAPDRFDLLLSDPSRPPPDPPPPAGAPVPPSDPLLARLAAPLIAALKQALAQQLPDAGAIGIAAVPALG